ncbi:hypothetical protein HDV00_007301, partial [Rhizophlyctis rosea]
MVPFNSEGLSVGAFGDSSVSANANFAVFGSDQKQDLPAEIPTLDALQAELFAQLQLATTVANNEQWPATALPVFEEQIQMPETHYPITSLAMGFNQQDLHQNHLLETYSSVPQPHIPFSALCAPQPLPP